MAKVKKIDTSRRLKRILGKKPKGPESGYIFFIKDYTTRSHLKGKDAIVAAARSWALLSAGQKQLWINRANMRRTEAEARVNEWNTKRDIIKKPTSQYGLFVKDYWATNRAELHNLAFRNAMRRISQAWMTLSNNDRAAFAQLHNLALQRYNVVKDIVLRSGQIDAGLRHLNMDQLRARLHGIAA